MRVLALSSSVRRDSRSKQLLDHLLGELKKKCTGEVEIVYHDLVEERIPQFSEDLRTAFFEEKEQTAASKSCDELSKRLIDELKAADLVLVATPIYNWAISTHLKCWIDHVVRNNHTFYTTPTGIEGLLTNKRAVFIVSSGLTPAIHVTKYLKAVFKFMGITDTLEIEAAYLDQDTVPNEAYAKVDDLVQKLLLT